MYFLLEKVNFYCHVSLLEGTLPPSIMVQWKILLGFGPHFPRSTMMGPRVGVACFFFMNITGGFWNVGFIVYIRGGGGVRVMILV